MRLPELITETLHVAEPFVHGGEEFVRGDRLAGQTPLGSPGRQPASGVVRNGVRKRKVDLEWLDSFEDDAEARYDAVIHAREEAKARAERALRDELKEQSRAQPALERGLKKQEAEQRKLEKKAREAREREEAERAIELRGGLNF
jgi:hypothetical protein